MFLYLHVTELSIITGRCTITVHRQASIPFVGQNGWNIIHVRKVQLAYYITCLQAQLKMYNIQKEQNYATFCGHKMYFFSHLFYSK